MSVMRGLLDFHKGSLAAMLLYVNVRLRKA